MARRTIVAENDSLRERRKAEKLLSIKSAARELFATHGFHGTPLRTVARVADVGFGTVTAYAVDKAGLAAMLFLDDLKHLPPTFEGVSPTSAPLLEQLLIAFGRQFEFWARDPDLSRVVLQQLELERPNPYAEAILKRGEEVRGEIADWLSNAKRLGQVRQDVDVGQAVEMLFALYITTVREWIMFQNAPIEAGLNRLRYLIDLSIRAIVAP